MASEDDVEAAAHEVLKLGERLGYVTYKFLEERLRGIAPHRLDLLLVEIDERGIKLIDEFE